MYRGGICKLRCILSLILVLNNINNAVFRLGDLELVILDMLLNSLT